MGANQKALSPLHIERSEMGARKTALSTFHVSEVNGNK